LAPLSAPSQRYTLSTSTNRLDRWAAAMNVKRLKEKQNVQETGFFW
jgi:hypothetical protein